MHHSQVQDGITGAAFARAVGTSYRVIDYWCRTSTLCPSLQMADGFGSVRIYSSEDVALGRVLVAVSAFGTGRDTLCRIVDVLRNVPSERWAGRILIVPPEGRVVLAENAVEAILGMAVDAQVGAFVVRLDAVLEPEAVR